MAVYEVGSGKTYATIQAAADAVFAAAGGVDFTETQEIRIYDGTYTETVALNSGLRPLPKYRLIVKAADGNDSVILRNDGLTGHAFNDSGVESVTYQDFEIQNNIATASRWALYLSGGSAYLSNMTIKASSARQAFYLANLATLIEDCTFEGTSSQLVRSHGYDAVWRRCTFQGGVYDLYGCSAAFESCVFAGCGTLYYGAAVAPRRIAPTVVSNCLFYNATYAFKLIQAGQGLSLKVRNCIFHTVTTCLENTGGPIIFLESNRNCFYNCGKIGSVDGTDYTTLADWQAYSPMYGDSPDADSIDSDPELVDAPNDDFSLTPPSVGDDGSPCYRAGVNAGVEKDQTGTLYHEQHPDIGSWSSGQEDSSPPTALAVVDEETGTSVMATITAEDEKDELFILSRLVESADWTEFSTSRRGSGTIQITGLAVARYEFLPIACRNGSSSAAGVAIGPSAFQNVSAADAPEIPDMHDDLMRNIIYYLQHQKYTTRGSSGTLFDHFRDSTRGRADLRIGLGYPEEPLEKLPPSLWLGGMDHRPNMGTIGNQNVVETFSAILYGFIGLESDGTARKSNARLRDELQNDVYYLLNRDGEGIDIPFYNFTDDDVPDGGEAWSVRVSRAMSRAIDPASQVDSNRYMFEVAFDVDVLTTR